MPGITSYVDIHLIQSIKMDFALICLCFSKYPDTFINSYFYKMTLLDFACTKNH